MQYTYNKENLNTILNNNYKDSELLATRNHVYVSYLDITDVVYFDIDISKETIETVDESYFYQVKDKFLASDYQQAYHNLISYFYDMLDDDELFNKINNTLASEDIMNDIMNGDDYLIVTSADSETTFNEYLNDYIDSIYNYEDDDDIIATIEYYKENAYNDYDDSRFYHYFDTTDLSYVDNGSYQLKDLLLKLMY